MPIFEESRLRFEFGDGWEVRKYDESLAYERLSTAVDETKGVDFVGVYQEVLYFIEVKNFRGYRIENQPRITSGELLIEVAQKVRDTLAGVVAVARQSNVEDLAFWERCYQLLGNRQRVIKVVLWLEKDLPPQTPQRRRNLLSIGIDLLKPKLKWLTNRVLIVEIDNANLPDVKVTFLPQI